MRSGQREGDKNSEIESETARHRDTDGQTERRDRQKERRERREEN